MIVYKGQGIDWHPQSDSLGVSPLKQTQSTPSLVSSSCCLVESLRQLICFIGCFNCPIDKLIGPCFYRISIFAGRSHLVHGWRLLMPFPEKTSSTPLMTMLMSPSSQIQWSSKLLTSPSHAISNPLSLPTTSF